MFLTILLIIILLVLLPTAMAGVIGAPLAVTNKKMLTLAIEKAGIGREDRFYDLGSGTGRVLIEVAKKTEAKVIGFELSPVYYLLGWLNLKIHRVKNCKLYLKNFYQANLSEADVVFCFLMPRALVKLKTKLKKELKPGAKVISYCFEIPGWQPAAIIKKDKQLPVYIYLAP